MELATQLNISMPNLPGSLAKVCDKLRAADVNIEAVYCNEGTPETSIHLIVDDLETAKIVLGEMGKVTATSVLSFTMKNRPGGLAYVARMCAGAGINIRYVYSTTHGKEATVFIGVDDVEKAVEHFKNLTVKI